MNLFRSSRPFGLDIGSSMIKAAELTQVGSTVVVSRTGIAPMPSGAFSSGVIMDPPEAALAIRNLCRENHFRSKRVVAVPIGGDEFFARLKVERGGGQALDERVRQEAARVAPFPIAAAHLDFDLLDNSFDLQWSSVLVAAAKPEKIERLQQLLGRAGKTATVVDVTASALANAFEVNYQPKPLAVSALVDIGASGMTVCIVRGSTPLLAEHLPLAAMRLSLGVEESNPAERIVIELERLFERMDEIAEEHPLDPGSKQIERLVLSGGASRTAGLAGLLRERIGLPFEEFNPFRKIEIAAPEAMGHQVWDHAHCMAIAVGLALRGLD